MDLSSRLLGFALHGAGWVLWLLLALSIVSVAVMIERFRYLRRHRPDARVLAADIRQLLAGDGARVPPADEAESLAAAMEGAKLREKMRLERNLTVLATLGSNAPFIGLFGTVLGIIKAFHDLAGSGAAAGGASVVMAGISEALVATAVGLMVAIPAVVAFNFLSRRVRALMPQVEWLAHQAMIDVKRTLRAPAPIGAEGG